MKFQITRQRFSPIEHLCRLRNTKARNILLSFNTLAYVSIYKAVKLFNILSGRTTVELSYHLCLRRTVRQHCREKSWFDQI